MSPYLAEVKRLTAEFERVKAQRPTLKRPQRGIDEEALVVARQLLRAAEEIVTDAELDYDGNDADEDEDKAATA